HDRDRRQIVERAILLQGAPNLRLELILLEWKAKQRRVDGGRAVERRDRAGYGAALRVHRGVGRGTLRRFHRRHTLARYSPGSTPSAVGDKGCFAPPPIATIRSIASRARSATSLGTVMWYWVRRRASRTLGKVVTFMYAQEARSFAAWNRLLGFSRRSRCRMPTSVATMNSFALD